VAGICAIGPVSAAAAELRERAVAVRQLEPRLVSEDILTFFCPGDLRRSSPCRELAAGAILLISRPVSIAASRSLVSER
jgi:hypothetical protein